VELAGIETSIIDLRLHASIKAIAVVYVVLTGGAPNCVGKRSDFLEANDAL
jgi:hypothetical protein